MLSQAAGQEGGGVGGTGKLGEEAGGPLRVGGQGEPIDPVAPHQIALRRRIAQGAGGGQDFFQGAEGEPEPPGRLKTGEDQDAAQLGVCFDLKRALHRDTSLGKGLSGETEGQLLGEILGGEAVLPQVVGGEVERHTGGADGLDGHRGPPPKKAALGQSMIIKRRRHAG